MIEIQKILIPVDFSAPSEKAVDYAIAIAKGFSSDLILASAVEDPIVLPYTTPRAEEIYFAGVEAKLGELIPREVRDARNCQFLAIHGEAEEAILSAIAQEAADLVVIGSHGRRAFKRWFVGSVTEHILRRSPVPVLTVSHPEEHPEPWSIANGQIVYASGMSGEPEPGLEIAYDLARVFRATLTVLHVIEPPTNQYGTLYIPSSLDPGQLKDDVLAQLQKRVRDAIGEDPRVRVTVGDGKPHQTVLDTALELRADLIVVNQHSKSRLERALLGATADRVIRIAEAPVLSVPMPVG